MAADYESVEARLRAYIAPNAPQTRAENDAFEQAVEAQVEYESAAEGDAQVPMGVSGYSAGNFSVNYGHARSGEFDQFSISPYARAILQNAGLLRHSMPVARRL